MYNVSLTCETTMPRSSHGSAAALAAVAATLVLFLPKLQRWWRRRRWAQEQDRLATLVSFDDAPAVAALVSRLDASEPCVVAGVALVEDLQGAVAVAVAIELPSLKRIDDAVVPVANARRLVENSKKSAPAASVELIEIEGAGHCPHEEGDLSQEIGKFIK